MNNFIWSDSQILAMQQQPGSSRISTTELMNHYNALMGRGALGNFDNRDETPSENTKYKNKKLLLLGR